MQTIAAADKAAAKKFSKYNCDLAGSHLFFPVAIETAGTWNQTAVELVQEISRRITMVTEDTGRQHSCFMPVADTVAKGHFRRWIGGKRYIPQQKSPRKGPSVGCPLGDEKSVGVAERFL